MQTYRVLGIKSGDLRMEIEMYKIMDSDLKFSSGGLHPMFTREGKTWNSKARLHAHFRLLNEYGMLKKCYDGCRIIRISLNFEENRVTARGCSVDADEFYQKLVSPCGTN